MIARVTLLGKAVEKMNAECRMQNSELRMKHAVVLLHSEFCILNSAFDLGGERSAFDFREGGRG
jgi:hypothetical protein